MKGVFRVKEQKKISLESLVSEIEKNGRIGRLGKVLNRSPSSRQLKKYKFFLPVEIYLLAVLCSLQVNFVFFHWR